MMIENNEIGTTPTETLKHEHQIILLVLGAVGREMRQIQAGGPLPEERIGQMIDFIQNFADRCHHAKEEKLLFARMEERGIPVHGGPIGVMLQEHDEGRRLVRAAAEALPQASAGDVGARTTLSSNLLGFVRLLRAHIDKEDNILYPMADEILTAADQADLAAAFERVEAEEMGEGTHERYHQLAHEWAG
jgi:hemerythrin-like domain-containing protein